jgi:hypothetical protein
VTTASGLTACSLPAEVIGRRHKPIRGLAFCMRRFRAISRHLALRVSPGGYRIAGSGQLCNERRHGSFQTTARISPLSPSLRARTQRPLSRINFQETDKGRPYLPDLPNVSFSFSSCRSGFLGAWSSTHQIGIDLEDQTRNLEAVELAQQFFSQAEAEAVRAVGGLARLRIF